MRIAFFGSSLVSCYWNGAATYYRGLIRALASLGHEVTFYEPDAFDRQRHRDMEDPEWARVVVYSSQAYSELDSCLDEASDCDVIVKASGVGVFDEYLEARVPQPGRHKATIFWDVDAPATLDRVLEDACDSFRNAIPRFSAILTYGGGQRVIDTYLGLGAKICVPVYNAVDPSTHFPVDPDPAYRADLAFLGNRLPDREARVEEFFLRAASLCNTKRFLLGGSGWSGKAFPENVRYIGHVSTTAHNSFNCSSLAVLNINRLSMAAYGFSPPTRVFEAAAAGACLITDGWEGIDSFLKPGTEVLVANNGSEVASLVCNLDREEALAIGSAARERILREHTYAHRARQVNVLLNRIAAQEPAVVGVTA
jgi:spore maturation protein CgeB